MLASWIPLVVGCSLEKQKEIEKGRKSEEGEGLYDTGEMTGAGMAGACQMKASKSALKSTHTFPFSPSVSGCFSVHCLLALRQHIVHSAECSGGGYIRDRGRGGA